MQLVLIEKYRLFQKLNKRQIHQTNKTPQQNLKAQILQQQRTVMGRLSQELEIRQETRVL